MRGRPILIAGAGIGGLTAALALARIGADVIVIERRTRVEEAGAGIQLSPNATHILRALGLLPSLQRLGAEPRVLVVRDGSHGRRLQSMPLAEAMNYKFGAPYLTIHRADLHTLLLDHVRANPKIKLLFGRKAKAIEQESLTGLTLVTETENGEDRIEGAALIGADGIWSDVAKIIGDTSEPEFRHHCAWRGTVPLEAWPKTVRADESGLWLARNAHLVHYPIRQGKVINVVALTEDETNEPGWTRHGDPQFIRNRFTRWTQDARAVIQAVESWQTWSLYDRTPRTQWSKGLITLMGDAAHPVLPYLAQGAALAIEDAAILAEGITNSPADLRRAFATYATKRRSRTERVQKTARENGKIFHYGFPLSIARNYILARTDLSERYDWLYGWRSSIEIA